MLDLDHHRRRYDIINNSNNNSSVINRHVRRPHLHVVLFHRLILVVAVGVAVVVVVWLVDIICRVCVI